MNIRMLVDFTHRCLDFTATDEYTDVDFSCFSSQMPICVDFTATDVQLQEYPLPRKSFT